MAVAVRSEKLRELVDEDAEVEQVATGFTFTEGPIWMPDGSLHFSDMPGDKRRRWHPAEGVTVLRDPSNKCNGMTIDNDGNLLVCEHVTSSLVREKPDGTRETLATHWQGKELNSPNDVIVASDGSIIFTDPTYGRMPGFGLEREQDLDFQGVYRLPAGGGEIELLVDDFAQPNGLCFSPDESLLYINDTTRAHIRVFDVGPNHALSNGRVFAGEHRHRRPRHRRARRRDEARRARQRLRHGPEAASGCSAPTASISARSRCRRTSATSTGATTTGARSTSRRATSVYRVRMKVAGNKLGYMN